MKTFCVRIAVDDPCLMDFENERNKERTWCGRKPEVNELVIENASKLAMIGYSVNINPEQLCFECVVKIIHGICLAICPEGK